MGAGLGDRAGPIDHGAGAASIGGYRLGNWLTSLQAQAEVPTDEPGAFTPERRRALEELDPRWCPAWPVTWQRAYAAARALVVGVRRPGRLGGNAGGKGVRTRAARPVGAGAASRLVGPAACERCAALGGQLAGEGLDLSSLQRREGGGTAGPLEVAEGGPPGCGEAAAPRTDGVQVQPGLTGDAGVGPAPGRVQHHVGALPDPVLGPVAVGHFLQPLPLGGGQGYRAGRGNGQGRQADREKWMTVGRRHAPFLRGAALYRVFGQLVAVSASRAVVRIFSESGEPLVARDRMSAPSMVQSRVMPSWSSVASQSAKSPTPWV